jgi:hypothetical protein
MQSPDRIKEHLSTVSKVLKRNGRLVAYCQGLSEDTPNGVPSAVLTFDQWKEIAIASGFTHVR